ncbi:MAG TPA: substrate-binding domain-containing protein [Parafilimonas sp.]|nr:substrate-binding domain-containing protein [Parafilimonas sp.]
MQAPPKLICFDQNILTRVILVALCMCLLLFSSCNETNKKKGYTIGFSQCTMVNKWRQTMLEEMKRELAFHPEVKFVFKDANGNTKKQIQQIQELIDEKIDLLIVSPQEAAPITPIVEEAFDKGIKVIIVDRRTLSENYTAYVGGSNYDVGATAASFANSILKNGGNVLEISDIPGSSADIDRHEGFIKTLNDFNKLHYVGKIYEEGDEHPSNKNATLFLKTHNDIQLIFAQNDRLALSTYNACNKLGIANKIKIIGVDGLPGVNGGIDLVEKGKLKATILYPTGGKEAIQTAATILENKPFKRENQLAITVIDSTNVRVMRLQDEKLAALQSDIERGQKKIKEQEIITNNQTDIIYAISVSLALALIFGFILFYYLRENKKITKRLALKNEEILKQSEQLIELGKKANEANEARIQFFTKLSHELRTPLTLILAPLEDLYENEKIVRIAGKNLSLIQKNSLRLLKLINQLMDFRKIEIDKLKIKVSQNDIVSFLNQIIEAYKNIAHKRNIDLRLFTNQTTLNVWFDETMLDKVLFNLLSNAFKFTEDNGYIYIFLEKNEADKTVKIIVEDNGIGMNKTSVEHAFELFYQGENENYRGSGLGLAVSKELIQLHRGTIAVESEKRKGTKFIITLPLENSDLIKNETPAGDTSINKSNIVFYEDQKVYTSDLLADKEYENELAYFSSDNSILIVEDNVDLRGFLKARLSRHYEIIEANDGVTAVQQAFDIIPDLIICDLMLPGKDGFAITHILKTDVRTSHIPIIHLTAKTSIQSQIEGMKELADSYITKPFNVGYLEENIKSLLVNRSILREHFSGEISSELKTRMISKVDRKFVNELNAFLESNIANENFGVEDICKHIGLSKMQLYRKIKALLNCNVNEYILNKRLQKSKFMLQNEELSISEIAYKVGFSSPAYFSTVFKSKFNLTPSEYKENRNTNNIR